MGRGRAKAKQTKVARELKYSSPTMDLDALQREIGSGTAVTTDDDGDHDEYSDYVDKYAADDDEDDRPAADPDADPVGDVELLADLGVSSHRLLTLCGLEGMLPADVTAEICQKLGCGDELEELREA